MQRVRFLILVLILELLPPLVKADEIPVLLMLKRSEQIDTSGCNFVEQVTALIYKEIIENKVKLWDSPAKEIQITGATLKEIERNSNTSFVNQETVFMYETWDNVKKEILTKTIGFSFLHKNENEEEVSYGYVDFKDLNELFLKTRINTNANGIYNSTYTTYLLKKNFTFNIVQFAGKAVKSLGESDELKKSYIRNLKFNQSLVGYYPPDKFISYIIDNYSEGTDQKTMNSRALFKQIEDYFMNNQEVFFNMGGDRITSHIQRNKMKVTRVEVNEMWRKINGEITYEPRSMVIYINDSALNEMSPRAIADMEIIINEQNFTTFLKEKQFNLIVTRINSQVIKRKDAYLYLKGLFAAEWNRVIEYVLNY
jgi:hypothetical protein